MARRLLGDPPRATAAEWRYGSHGSLSVHPQSGTWHDFEADAGGGTLDLVEHLLQTDKAGALAWLVAARPDLMGRARAYGSMVQGGMDEATAAELAGLA